MTLAAAFHRFKTDWRLLVPLLAVNAAGMGFGWYYYTDVGQFDLDHLACGPGANEFCEPWWTWLVVADSPNAVLLFFVAALAYRLTGRRNRWVDAGAFVLNIYVGLWTTFLFLTYPERMGTFDWAGAGDCVTGEFRTCNANPILFFAHMGMPLQAFILAPDLATDHWSWPRRQGVGVAAALYIAVDYWGPMLHPAPFLHPDDRLLHIGSPLLMVLAGAAWLAVVQSRHWLPRLRGDAQS